MVESKSFRELGNEFFKAKNYEQAIEIYSKGILSTNDKNELSLLYSNRAQCYLNINYPIYALTDSIISCQEQDASIKALFRMATAYYELNDCKNAYNVFKFLYTKTKDKEQEIKLEEIERKQKEKEKELQEKRMKGTYSPTDEWLFFAFITPKSVKISDLQSYFTELVKGKPSQIVELPEYGKSLITSRDFKAGEEILTEKAFICCHLNDNASIVMENPIAIKHVLSSPGAPITKLYVVLHAKFGRQSAKRGWGH